LPVERSSKRRKNSKKKFNETIVCEFEEESMGKPNKHRYYCTFLDLYEIGKKVQKNHFSTFENFKLNLEAMQLKQSTKIDRLIAVDAVRTKLTPYNFQMHTALKVINEMNSNAILADEVGLGKTIEAGLVMKELLLREEVNSILVVSPKSLLTQWKNEMAEKFGESFAIANYPGERADLELDNRIICSHNFLARKIDEFENRTWDLVVVDEAHAFRNTQSKSRASIASLRKNHLLLRFV